MNAIHRYNHNHQIPQQQMKRRQKNAKQMQKPLYCIFESVVVCVQQGNAIEWLQWSCKLNDHRDQLKFETNPATRVHRTFDYFQELQKLWKMHPSFECFRKISSQQNVIAISKRRSILVLMHPNFLMHTYDCIEWPTFKWLNRIDTHLPIVSCAAVHFNSKFCKWHALICNAESMFTEF